MMNEMSELQVVSRAYAKIAAGLSLGDFDDYSPTVREILTDVVDLLAEAEATMYEEFDQRSP